MICKNCEQQFQGSFCNNCGQKSNVKRINFAYLIREIPSSVFQLNSGILFTIKLLSTKPGRGIKDFLDGKRKAYFKPLAFVLVLSAIYVFVAHFTSKPTYLEGIFTEIKEIIKQHQAIELTVFVKLLNWLSNNFAYSALVLLPVFSLASYLAFLKSKLNYFEHLVLNMYIFGQQILIYIFFVVLFSIFKVSPKILELTSFVSATLYLFWVYFLFFQSKKLVRLLFTFFAYLLHFILIVILITIATFILFY